MPLPPLSEAQVTAYALGAGFQGAALQTAVAVARAESTWIPDNINPSSGASGLWQILPSAHPEFVVGRLTDPAYNANAAWKVSAGGTNWQPWVTYTNGAYLAFMAGGVKADTSATGATAQPGPRSTYRAPPPTAEDARYVQKTFDKRHYRASIGGSVAATGLFGGPTFRGWIANLAAADAGLSDDISFSGQLNMVATRIKTMTNDTDFHTLQFLYNPNTVTMTYSANPNLLDTGELDRSQFNPPVAMSNSTTTIGFQLLFDRTFEVMDGDKLGVLTDVRTLERIVGITVDSPIMLAKPVVISLTHDVSLQMKAVLNSMTVQFTHFSEDMVPLRCTVDVQGYRIPTNLTSDTTPDTSDTAPVAKPAGPAVSGVVSDLSGGTHGGLPSGYVAHPEALGGDVPKPGLDKVLQLPVFQPGGLS